MQQHARVQNKPKLITVYNYSVQNNHLSPEMLEYCWEVWKYYKFWNVESFEKSENAPSSDISRNILSF